MHQVRLFVGLESQIRDLEDEVNAWLAEHTAIKVVGVLANISPQSMAPYPSQAQAISRTANAPSDVLVCIHYEK